MSVRRTFRFVLLSTPLLVFALLFTLPLFAERLSLAFHGHPFARIVPKEGLNVFEFVTVDNLRARAIVFSHGKAIGWIYEPMTGLPRFIHFSNIPNFDIGGFDPWFDICFLLTWFLRWYLLPVQAVVLLLWLRSRGKREVSVS